MLETRRQCVAQSRQPDQRAGRTRHRRRARPKLEPLEDRTLLDGTPAWLTFAHDPQHTGLSAVASQPLSTIHWQTPVDLSPNNLIHYGSPLVTQANTVIVPVRTGVVGGFDAFRVDARNGADGTLKWSLTTDYRLPPHNWTPSYSPTLTSNRLYYPGAAGSVLFRDNPDAPSGTTGRLAFYGTYDPALINRIFVNTPITSDAAGNFYFGFQVTDSTLTLKSGIARIGTNGVGTWVAARTAAADDGIEKVLHNSAPALSNDGSTVYVAVNGGSRLGYLLGLNSTNLTTRTKVLLRDPRDGTPARMLDDGTSSPTVGPDGRVYFGVWANNHLRGFLLQFSGDLAQTRTPGAFGWDDTASIVPRTMVPSYTGPSDYLLMSKYNDYIEGGGSGVNKIAILDPNDTQRDPVSGITSMKEILTIAGVTPDPVLPRVREWCINTAAVDPFTKSVLANSEDGVLYRWDLTTNTLSESIRLTRGIGEAYTPTVIGVDGTVYAINDHVLFAVHAPVGPFVRSTSPVGNVFGAFSSLRVTFDREIDVATFTPAKIASFTGPQGLIPVTRVAPVTGSGNKQFDVSFPIQGPLGRYDMVIGPDIRDLAGHQMDQNDNGILGEIPGDQYLARFTIQGPRILRSTPTGDETTRFFGPINHVHVEFNEPMDVATFTPARVSFAGPRGGISVTRVDVVGGTNNTQFDISFASQTATGFYNMVIGPDIRDPAGHRMDQNGNFIEGEVPGDQYRVSFGLRGPKIIAQSPSGNLLPMPVSSLQVTFNEPMNPATFTPDKIASFLGPHGVIRVNEVVPVAGTDYMRFEIRFNPVVATGPYRMVIGPDIRDTFGNAMDQNDNLIPGEIPGDQYTAAFNLLGPRIDTSTSGRFLGQVTSVRVGFNEPMDPTTFTPDQIANFTGPGGDIPVTGVFAVGGTNNRQFDITFAPQAVTGIYRMVIGPDIRDYYGNPMDQNGNLVPGEPGLPPAGDQFLLTFGIEGPRITASTPIGGSLPNEIYALRVTFNVTMDASTFTPDKVASFRDPQGNDVPVTDVQSVPFTGETQFDIFFDPLTVSGTYTMVIGPDIRDLYGNPMDQNNNLIPGEIPGDQYTATITVQGPRIIGQFPTGGVHPPADTVLVTFNEPMDPATFTLDRITRFTGPGGVSIDVTDISPYPSSGNTIFTVSFAPQTAVGAYQMVIGTGIRDAYGNPSDQAYTANFTVTDLPLLLYVGATSTAWNNGMFFLTQVSIAQFATQSVDRFDLLWIDASAGSSPVLRNRAGDIAAFVADGGGLVTDDVTDFTWVPNAPSLQASTNFCRNDVRLTTLGGTHPVTAGLTDAGLSQWNCSWFAFFTATAGMDILATSSDTAQPLILAGNFGSGRIVYLGLAPSIRQPLGQSRELMRQAARWVAMSGLAMPGSGESATPAIAKPAPSSAALYTAEAPALVKALAAPASRAISVTPVAVAPTERLPRRPKRMSIDSFFASAAREGLGLEFPLTDLPLDDGLRVSRSP